MLNRRDFVTRCAAGVVAAAYPLRIALAHAGNDKAHDNVRPAVHNSTAHDCEVHRHTAGARAPHPKPRPGITGAKVLTAAKLSAHPALIPLFDAVRKIPQIIDGIRCNCLCGNPPTMYSLLSCYEGEAMAQECAVCQGQAKLAVRLHGEGKTLAEIRVAVDAKFA